MIEFEYEGVKIVILFADELSLEELALMAGVYGRPLFWYDGFAFIVYNLLLDPRVISEELIRRRVLYIEHVSYAKMPKYQELVKIVKEDLVYRIPILRAVGIVKAIARGILGRE